MSLDAKFCPGDAVEIIAGQYAGSTGTVEKVLEEQLTVMIDGMEDLPSSDWTFKSSGGTRSIQFTVKFCSKQLKLLG